ncbi:MAG: EI24 domain-containing protein, partial [Flavobacteriales bacterium]|nr:EI24 domain-containing protein [Flavobacteriales bacterium]
MTLLKDFIAGISTYGKAIEFIHKNHLKRYFLFPILLNILLLSGGLQLLGSLSDDLIEYVKVFMDLDAWEFWGSEILAGTVLFLVWLILKIFTFILVAFLGGHLVLILMSPILAYVSEKTENILTGKDYPFNFKQMLKDTLRGMHIAIRNSVLEFIVIIALLIFSFVPVIGLISTPLLFLIASYYYGSSFIDYSLERKKLGVKERVLFMKENRGLVTGSGFLFSLLLLIPFIGVALSPFGAIVSTVAATMALHKKDMITEQN